MRIGGILGALAALCATAAVTASAGEGARPLKVGVVDVDRVLREYKKSDDLYKKIAERSKPREDELKKRSEMIRAEQRKLLDSGREADSIEVFKDKQAIDLKIAELRVDEKKFLADRGVEELGAMNDVWSDVLAASEKYAKDNGLDLVIKQQLREDDAKTREAFYRNVAACTTLYYSGQLDITEALLKAMNAAYARGGTYGTKAPEKSGKKG